MKKHILLIPILVLIIYSCKTNNSSSFNIVAPVDNDIYYYQLRKEEIICKYYCKTEDIRSLSQQFIRVSCPHLVAAFSYIDLKNENNNLPPKMIELIDSIVDPNTLKILDADNKEFQKFDKFFTQYGSCDTSTEINAKNCVTCKTSENSPAGTIVTWKNTQFEPSSESFYEISTTAPIGRLQWSKLMGVKTYKEAYNTCKQYKDFKNHSDWHLPSIEDLKSASEYNLGKELNLSSNDLLVWSSTEVEVDIATDKDKNKEKIKKVFVSPLIYDEDDPPTTQLVDKNKSYHTICVRTYSYD